MADPPTELGTDGVGQRVQRRTAAIRDAVTKYLSRHPNACDTSAGIGVWWLPELGATQKELDAVLETMVAQGLMESIRLADDTIVYRGRRMGSD